MQVSIVLGSYNRKHFLKKTIDSVRRSQTNLLLEILVVDGGSTDGSLEWLSQQKDIITIIQHNRGQWLGRPLLRRSWGYFMNLGFKAAQGKYILMMSDDCLIYPDAIAQGVTFFESHLNAGRNLAAVPFFWRDWPQSSRFWVGKTFGQYFVNHGLFLRDALASVDYLDETHFQFYHADGDLCLRLIDKGYEILPCKTSFIEHYAHANMNVRASNAQSQSQDWLTYESKWKDRFNSEGATNEDAEYLPATSAHDGFAQKYWQFMHWSAQSTLLMKRGSRKIEGYLRSKSPT